MSFGYAVFALLGVCVAGGIFFMRRAGSEPHGDADLGSVSTSWLAEHRSGHQ
jgi:hypothetical protein